MSIIAIASGAYCSGEEIARRVAERLEYELVAEELLADAASRFETSVEKLTRAMTGSRAFFDFFTRGQEKSVAYIRSALADLIGKDSVVYHGHATYLLPGDIGHVLRVGVVADRAYRIAQAVEKDGLGEAEAGKRIDTRDQELAQWAREERACGPWDSSLFDIKIPLPSTSLEGAVDLICENLVKDPIRPTDRSVQAALDFQLEARVGLALVDDGIHNGQVSVSEGEVTVVLMSKPTPQGRLGRTVQALRFENAEEDVRKVCSGIEGVDSVRVVPGKRPAKTLLVDDEQEYIMTLSERLEMRDIPSDVVYDGQQALEFVAAGEEPEVMVLDLRMPGLDGLEVLRRIRRDHPSIQVIVVTGHGTEKDEREARELGAFDYLQKPVDINKLAERINAASEKASADNGAGEAE